MAEFAGLSEFVARLLDIANNTPRVLERAVFEESLLVTKASIEDTPVATGALRGSHETLLPQTDGDTVFCVIQVGGPAAPYAVYVHEDLEAHHPVGHAKFLANAIAVAAPGFTRRVADRVQVMRGSR